MWLKIINVVRLLLSILYKIIESGKKDTKEIENKAKEKSDVETKMASDSSIASSNSDKLNKLGK